MKLIIGGAFQGKRRYAAECFGISEEDILSGENAAPDDLYGCKAVSEFHLLIKSAGTAPEAASSFIDGIYERNPDIIIICDEVGAGITPVERIERDWRETVGRTCCRAAELSDTVVRIHCGLPQTIKEMS